MMGLFSLLALGVPHNAKQQKLVSKVFREEENGSFKDILTSFMTPLRTSLFTLYPFLSHSSSPKC